MTWVAVGVAGASMLVTGIQNGEQSVNAANNITAQNKAKIEQIENQFALSTQNMHNNQQLIQQQRLKNDVLIQENKLEALDLFASAFAGSGISGRSVDRLENEIAGDVSEAIGENKRQSEQQSDRQFLGLMRQADANKEQYANLMTFDASSAQANQEMAVLASGVSSFSSSASSGKFDKYMK